MLAKQAGIEVPEHQLVRVADKPVLLSWRFDREKSTRVPFLSAMSMMALRDGERSSYPELMEVLLEHGARATMDKTQLYRRMVFNVLISNVDDHLRNHGFVFEHRLGGWVLSPLYDVVPRPGHAYERMLHLEVGDKGKLATLDNALSRFAAFTAARSDAVELVRRVWGEVRQWKTTFEAHGADAELLNQVSSAFRKLDDIASPALVAEIRKGQ